MEHFEMELVESYPCKIKVIGVGGAGGNAVNRMVQAGLRGVEFIAINTDQKALDKSLAHTKIAIGRETTRGLGAGANPEKGRQSIEEDRDLVSKALEGADMVFIAAGMGGGTGTGAAPIVAEICREMGVLSLAVVTKPFQWEFVVRQKNSLLGLDSLHGQVDTLITIPNNKILGLDDKLTLDGAFAKCDEVLMNAVRGVTDIINRPGLVNIDLEDVRTVVRDGGDALMGTGLATGEKRALMAAEQAISSPLLEDSSVAGATGLLVHFNTGPDFLMTELNEAMDFIYKAVGEDVESNAIFGVTQSEELVGSVQITVIATGFGRGMQGNSRGAKTQTVKPVQQAPAVEQGPTINTYKPNAATPSAPRTGIPQSARAQAPKQDEWIRTATGANTVNNPVVQPAQVPSSKFQPHSYEKELAAPSATREHFATAEPVRPMSHTQRLTAQPKTYGEELEVPPFLRGR